MAAERRELVPSTWAARASASDDVLGPRIGLTVAELDQAAPLARRLDRLIRQPVVIPSVAHETAREALDVHDFQCERVCRFTQG